MARHDALWQPLARVSARERADADAFWDELVGETRWAELNTRTPPEWLRIARRLPLTYRRPQGVMHQPILGVIVHTTNHQRGADTLERFQADWNALQSQSTHFMVDRNGNIGQFRSTRQAANHVKQPPPRWDRRYFGIEHIARPRQPLTAIQLERSARLIGDLAVLFGFPARALPGPGRAGIGIHIDFRGSGCGIDVFWSGRDRRRTETYARLVERAYDFSTVGF